MRYLIPIGILIFFLALYLFLTLPSVRGKRTCAPYKTALFAHRGLHGGGIAENTLPAFRRAVDAGYGIELDVRLSADGELVVYHDDTLERATGMPTRISDLTAAQLSAIPIFGTSDHVPTFKEVLNVIGGKVPLLVEIKENATGREVAEATVKMLENYEGPLLIESFDPRALGVVRRQMPNVPRGQLNARLTKDEPLRALKYRIVQNFFLNFIARPDFVAYDFRDSKFFPFLVQKLFGAPLAAWTVRSEEDENEAKGRGYSSLIFENYLPKKDDL